MTPAYIETLISLIEQNIDRQTDCVNNSIKCDTIDCHTCPYNNEETKADVLNTLKELLHDNTTSSSS